MINIENFEEFIPVRILERGYDIYASSDFLSIYKNKQLEFHFKYQGTEMYDITVDLNQEMDILFSDCTCPYDYSEHCKHEVAAFYLIKFHIDEIPLLKKYKDPLESDETVEFLIESLDANELKIILQTLPINIKHLKTSIINYKNFSQDKDVLTFLNKLQTKDESYFVNYSLPSNILIDDFIEILNKLAKENNLKELLSLYLRTFELLEKDMMHISNEWQKDRLYSKVSLITPKLYNELIKKNDDLESFEWLNYLKERINDFNAQAIFNFVAMFPIKNHQFECANNLCEKWLDKASERELLLYGEFVEEYIDEESLLKLYLDNLELKEIQLKAIDLFKNKKQYIELINLLSKIENNYGLDKHLEIEMFNAYLNNGQKYLAFDYADKKIREGSTHMFDYLKEVLSENEFKKISEKYALPFFYEDGLKVEVYGKALVEHDRLENLFILLKDNQYHLPKFVDDLDDDMLFKLYIDYIKRIVITPGRHHYRHAANELKYLKDKGRMDVAKQIKLNILSIYPNRSALADEFKGI